MSARVAYVYLPRWPLQRLVLDQPSLSGRPVVLHALDRGHQRVLFASSAAQKLGVTAGQSVSAAEAVGGDALVVRRFDEAAHRHILLSTGEALLPLAPGFQLDDAEGLWLDASAAPLAGGEAAWARRVLTLLAAGGWRARCVVASARFTAQAVARYSPEAVEVVPPQGAAMLAPVPLEALERGWLGPGAMQPFRALGLSTLGELAGLSPGALVARHGALGLQASRLSRGTDDSGFVPTPLPEVLEEAIEFDWPAEQLEPVMFALKTAIDRLCARLQGRQLAAVQLRLSLAPQNAPLPLRLARPSSNAKMLLDLSRHRLADLAVHEPIEGLRVVVDEACPDPGRQLMLGASPAGEAELEVVLSRLQTALGPEALFAGSLVPQHRPEDAWQKSPFRPPDSGTVSALWGAAEAEWALGATGEPPPETEGALTVSTGVVAGLTTGDVPTWRPGEAVRSDAEAQVGDLMAFIETHGGKVAPRADPERQVQPETSVFTLLARPARLFREPSALQVELSSDGVMRWVTMLGRRRRVAGVQGPERLASGWWASDAFARDYYRVEVEGVGALWVFREERDGAFYVQGLFD